MSPASARAVAAGGALPLVRPAAALLLCALLGAASVLAFAPFYAWAVAFVTLTGFAWAVDRAATPGRAAVLGFAFGLGYFLTGVSWVFVSMHQYGGMSVPLAAFATAFFCSYLALFTAAAAWVTARTTSGPGIRLAVVFPAAWALAEWVRGWTFTGFPWIAIGYAQSPFGWLAGFAPLVGVYGVSLLTALGAGLLAWWSPWARLRPLHLRALAAHPALFALIVLGAAGYFLSGMSWTQPSGSPLRLTLIQGNIEQEIKWRPEAAAQTLKKYLDLTLAADTPLIVLPETALPAFDVEIPPDYLALLAEHARKTGGDILVGVPEYLAGDPPRYYNSVKSYGTNPTQVYRKYHLVPFGDYFPQWFFVTWVMKTLDIPMSSFSRGAPVQQPLAVAGQRVAVNICYEDVFGEEIIRQLPTATLLANFTNDAWWGDSIAAEQHLQMSQMRAQETGRYMVRATNTGVTAIIDQRGRVVRAAPQFATASLQGEVQGFGGATPYVRWGNSPFLVAAGLMLLPALLPRGRRTKT